MKCIFFYFFIAFFFLNSEHELKMENGKANCLPFEMYGYFNFSPPVNLRRSLELFLTLNRRHLPT